MAISFDTASSVSAGVVTSVTHAHTCSGSNRILWCGVQNSGTASTISGVTYAGVSMTLANSVSDTGNGEFISLFYLINPSSGTNNVVVSCSSSSIDLDCASYTGAAQTGQPDATTNHTASSGTTTTTTLTTVANDAWAVLFSYSTHGTVQNGTNATLRTNSSSNVALYDSGSAITPAGSFSMTSSITGASSDWSTLMASFSPASTSGIAFDANSNATGSTSGSTVTWSHTCTGSNGVLVVHLYAESGNTVTGVTYNGTAMTLGVKATTSFNVTTYTYFILGPTTGAHNIVASYGSSSTGLMYGIGASYTGVKQVSQPDVTASTSNSSVTSLSVSPTTTVNNDWIVGGGYGGNATGFAGTGAFAVRFHGTGGATSSSGWNGFASLDTDSPVTPAGSTAVGMSMTGSANQMSITAIALIPLGNTYTETYTESLTLSDTLNNVHTWALNLTESLVLAWFALFKYDTSSFEGNLNAGTGANDSSLGTVPWVNPGNLTACDTSYATVVLTGVVESEKLLATNFGFGIPSTATIQGVVISVTNYISYTGSETYQPFLQLYEGGSYLGSSKQNVWALHTTPTIDTSGSSTDVWGASLTPAIVNASTFGVGLWINIPVSTGVFTGNVDCVTMTVYYSLPTSYTTTLTDALVLADTLIRTTTRRLVESLPLADVLTNIHTWAKTLTESLSFADTIARATMSVLAESLVFADVVVRATTRKFTESLVLADTLIRATGRLLTESLMFADTLVRSTTRRLSESLSLADSLSNIWTAIRTYTESLPIADTLIANRVRVLNSTESMPFSDVFTGFSARVANLTESLVLADIFVHIAQFFRTYTESLPFADTFSAISSKILGFTESLVFADILIKSTGRTLSESVVLADAVALIRAIPAVLDESLVFADTFMRAIGKKLAELLPLADTFSRIWTATRTLTEPMVLNDTVKFLINGSDVIWSHVEKSLAATWTHVTESTEAIWTHIEDSADSIWTHLTRN